MLNKYVNSTNSINNKMIIIHVIVTIPYYKTTMWDIN